MPHTLEEKRLHANRKYHENPEHRAKLLLEQKEYGSRPEVKAKKKAYQRKRRLSKEYNLTVEQFESMLERCGGKCEICRERAAVCVDHNHTTGKVRGLLCRRCNTTLFEFENTERKESMQNYLKERGPCCR